MIIVKLLEGEIVQKIKEEMERRGVSKACITSGIGFVRDVVLGYFNGKDYDKEFFKGPFELLSAVGYFEEGNVHLHVVLADPAFRRIGGRVIGGHLISAKIAYMFQFAFEEVSE